MITLTDEQREEIIARLVEQASGTLFVTETDEKLSYNPYTQMWEVSERKIKRKEIPPDIPLALKLLGLTEETPQLGDMSAEERLLEEALAALRRDKTKASKSSAEEEHGTPLLLSPEEELL